MTYTHISYQNGDEFLLDHNAQDNGQTCRGDIIAMKIDDQWSRADRLAFTRVLLQTGNDLMVKVFIRLKKLQVNHSTRYQMLV